ncbi:MAG: hypothetical protein ACI9GW_003338 [Halieaceae bacterium]|jgi:hypothetical protein
MEAIPRNIHLNGADLAYAEWGEARKSTALRTEPFTYGNPRT